MPVEHARGLAAFEDQDAKDDAHEDGVEGDHVCQRHQDVAGRGVGPDVGQRREAVAEKPFDRDEAADDERVPAVREGQPGPAKDRDEQQPEEHQECPDGIGGVVGIDRGARAREEERAADGEDGAKDIGLLRGTRGRGRCVKEHALAWRLVVIQGLGVGTGDDRGETLFEQRESPRRARTQPADDVKQNGGGPGG